MDRVIIGVDPHKLSVTSDRGEHRLHVRGRQLSQQHPAKVRARYSRTCAA